MQYDLFWWYLMFWWCLTIIKGSLIAQLVKNPPAMNLGSIPGLGRCPGEGKGYLLRYSGLENSMEFSKSRTWLSDFHFHCLLCPLCTTLWRQLSRRSTKKETRISENHAQFRMCVHSAKKQHSHLSLGGRERLPPGGASAFPRQASRASLEATGKAAPLASWAMVRGQAERQVPAPTLEPARVLCGDHKGEVHTRTS